MCNFTRFLQKETIKFVRTCDAARAPIFGSVCAAGADLCAAEATIVPANGKACISTGLKVAIPYGYYGRVAPRSGLAAKKFLDVGAGVVDSDYRGVLHVLLFNFSKEDFQVNVGDRIAQLICEKICHPEYTEVQSIDDTDRGEGGFGSTGVATS
uniref:Deoxyuridine 5'-triphosphate nucleotidohydrolase n=1 Tax=Rhabditophanes sp. KR3021 TaxID=114890 RepID=A0AC35TGF9_9BILA